MEAVRLTWTDGDDLKLSGAAGSSSRSKSLNYSTEWAGNRSWRSAETPPVLRPLVSVGLMVLRAN